MLGDAVEKFIPEYPEINDTFGYEIAKKKEFYETKLASSESQKQPGELLDSQKFMKRFFSPHTPYKNALVYHLMGTGKCLHPLTKLTTNKGTHTAEYLWQNYSKTDSLVKGDLGYWCDPTEEIIVTSYNEKTEKLENSYVNKLYRQHVKEQLIVLDFSNGSNIVITQQHHLFNGDIWTNDFHFDDLIAILGDGDTLAYSKIVNISILDYNGWVYDFEVANHHNYIANGILCHNTCVSSAIVENFKNLEVDGKTHKPALVFVKSKELEKTYATDISKVCTNNIYTADVKASERKKEGFSMTEEAKMARITKKIRQVYTIVTYGTFLKKLGTDEEIKQKYSNRIIIVDEAHVLRIQPKKGKKSTKALSKIEEIEDVPDEELPEEDQDADVEVKENDALEDSVMLYQQMHRFLHTVENCRILLLTGTPIWDRTSEIASLMNLILSKEEQLPTGGKFMKEYFDREGNLKEGAKEILIEKFRGKVSYLRQMITTADREEMGTKKPWLKYITVFPCKMSEFQAGYADEAKNRLEVGTVTRNGKVSERVTKGGPVRRLERYATNIIFPIFDKTGNVIEGSYDKKTFEKYAMKKIEVIGGKGYITKYKIDNKYLIRELKNNLAEYSAKFAAIIDSLKKDPKEVTFIYDESVTGPGGVFMLALCLEIHGFEWVKSSGDISRPSEKRRRFAVIAGDPQATSGATQIQKLLDSHNKPDNCYGDRLQIIIGSEKIALGFTIKHVRKTFVSSPSWNIPSIDQAESRGFRFGSHDALKEDERYIKVYRLVAVEEGNLAVGKGYPSDSGFSAKKTSDVEVFGLAEVKDYKNAQIYRVLKEASFDCALNYERNVLKQDTNGTKYCDYMDCNYVCDAFPEKYINKKGKVYDYSISANKLDHSTFNLLYSGEIIKKYRDEILGLFNNYFSLAISSVQKLLLVENKDMFMLLQAIDSIIESRVLIRNRYGFGSYLREQGNVLFLVNSIASNAKYSDSVYIKNPLVTEKINMDHLIEILELQSDRLILEEFCKEPTADIFNKFSYGAKIILFEASYIYQILKGNKNNLSSVVLENIGDEIVKTMKDGSKIHILYTDEYKGIAYAVAAKDVKVTGFMRVLNPEEEKWEWLSDREKEETYVAELKKKVVKPKETIVEDENEYGVLGWISKKDKGFRIQIKKGDKWKRGRKCDTMEIADLVRIFVEKLKSFPPSNKTYDKLTKKELISRIKGRPGFEEYKDNLKDHDEDYLKGLLTILTMNKGVLCDSLKTWFEQNELLFER